MSSTPRRQPADQLLSDSLARAQVLLRQLRAGSPEASAENDAALQELRQLEARIVALTIYLKTHPRISGRAVLDRIRRARIQLAGQDFDLRDALGHVQSSLATICGRPVDDGRYRPETNRRASTGAWMNVRSSP